MCCLVSPGQRRHTKTPGQTPSTKKLWADNLWEPGRCAIYAYCTFQAVQPVGSKLVEPADRRYVEVTEAGVSPESSDEEAVAQMKIIE